MFAMSTADARPFKQTNKNLYSVIIEHLALRVSCAQNLFLKHKGKLRPCAFLYLPEGSLPLQRQHCPFKDNIHKKVSYILRMKNTGSWFYERSRDKITKDTRIVRKQERIDDL